MYLSKLEIFGFKSFATKTVVQLRPGITSIVGPNGCGKTNIVDAIRWVLGEQRASTLRTEKMQDIIFNGSKYRKQLNYAEVSLTLHNNKGVLPTEYTDVVITRRLFRDGDSEYLLNKNVVRLKDINNLFMDTGMGPDAYSVIELKMVDNLLSEDPLDRRKLFEEAAGITKYKSQRKSTLRKLDATKIDLLRVYDIISEVEKNVRSLKYQLGKYKRYQKEKDLLVESEVRLARFQYHNILNQIIPLTERLQKEKLQRDDAASQIKMDEALHERLEKSLDALDQEIKECENKIEERAQHLISAKERQVTAHQKSQSESIMIEKAKQRIDSAQERFTALDTQEKLYREQLVEAEASFDNVKSNYEGLKTSLERAEEELNEKQNSLSSLEHERATFIEKISELSAEKQKILAHSEAIENSSEARLKEKNDLEVDVKTDSKALQEANRRKKQLITERTLSDDKISELTEKMENRKIEIQQLEKAESTLIAELSLLRSRISMLEVLIEGRGGQSDGVLNLFENGGEIKGMLGSVAELLKVEKDYRVPIDQALGAVSDYVVVDTLENARAVAEWVTKAKKGSVTFLALGSLKPKNGLGNGGSGYVQASSVVSSAHDGLVAGLFGDLLITEKMNGRIDYPKGYRIVDKDGFMYDGAGLLKSGGQVSDFSSKIGRNELKAELKENLSEIEEGLSNNQKEIESSRASLETENSSLNELLLKEREILTEDARLAGNVAGLDAELRRMNERVRRMNAEGSDDEKLQKLETDANAIQVKIDSLEQSQSGFMQKYEKLSEKMSFSSKKKDEASAAHQEATISLMADERNLEALRFRISGIVETRSDTEVRIKSSFEEIERSKNSIESLKSELEESIDEITVLEEERKSLFEERDTHLDQKEKMRLERNELDRELRERRMQKDQVAESTNEMELRLTEFKMESERIFNYISNTYNADLTEASEGEPIDEVEEAAKLEQLRKRIESMGPVNMAVEDEYNSESERLEFLIKQRDDLTSAEKILLTTVKQIDNSARIKFLEAFEKIRNNFHRTFSMYFEGGEADLNLEADEDPLDAKIEIYARPPGKRNQALKQLSGGEKALTAIALLFAIYLVKPSPFCILDEVDAPLDDANIRRFSTVLDKFAKDTQFIVVTHNKDTMKFAGTLYGVTMEEVGVSKIVSVNLN